MAKFFHFTREQVVKKKDEKGQFIFKKDEQGNPTKEFETETFYRDDFFNLDKVIRAHMIDDDHVLVLLDDGHEETQEVPKVEKNKIVQSRVRSWVQSEISVKGAEKVQELLETLRNY